MNKNFALIGAAGYIAPRHMKSIKDLNCNLLVAVDKSDSVGILDSYFPEADFFTEIERFDRHIDKARHSSNPIHYFSICSPNYLHDSHIRLALRNGAHAICEKPLVINYKNLEYLKILENETGKDIYTIFQLRHHPKIIDMKNNIGKDKKHHIKLTYITSRGKWYSNSWKADPNKSGGLAANIGIHFFDMLTWVFGEYSENIITYKDEKTISGFLNLKQATVEWFLSIDSKNIPDPILKSGKKAFRSIEIDGSDFEFSDNFTDLHTISYSQILSGHGFRIGDSEISLKIVSEINNMV